MARDRWRAVMTVGILASLLLGLAATGLGIAALRGNPDHAMSTGPVTSLIVPSGGATVSGVQALDARPIGPGLVAVDFVATGGRLHDMKVGSGSPTIAGWGGLWDTRTTANGTYTLVSIGYDAQGDSSRSTPVVVNVRN